MPQPPRREGEATGEREAAPDLRDAPTEVGSQPRGQGSSPTVSYRAAHTGPDERAIVLPPRYAMREHLASGGQGDVYRVFDRELNREMVMKLLGSTWSDDALARARFVQEAQVTAQLQHPNIVPVHEIGVLADGRVYYTMAEVRGRTLTSVIEAVHAASAAAGAWAVEPGGVGFRRLVDAFHRVCEAVAYAHSLGVMHRDLKPLNVMLGKFGETLVLDWGLARVGRATDDAGPAPAIRRADDQLATRLGAVSGTVGYMAPEQARGEAVDVRADVYALGMILREILVGTPPSLGEIVGMPVAVAAPPGRPLPDELVAICLRATAIDRDERYPDAGALGQAVAEFLDGARKRERAIERLAQARAVGPQIDALRAQARALELEARGLLDPLPPSAPAEAKEPGWDLEDRARALGVEADLATLEMTRLIESSLVETELPEAHAMLAQHFRALHEEAEARREPTAKLEVLLRAHDRGEHAGYLAGTGALTLRTDRPAEVELRRYVVRGRRLRDEHVRHLGTTPLAAVELPHGSYLLVVRAPGCHDVRYPVAIGRQAHWDPRRAGVPQVVALPPLGAIGADEIYVAGGPFSCGGDPQAAGEVLARQEVWVDAFVMRRDPVTNAELLALVNAAIDARDPRAEELAARVVPRHRGATAGDPGPLVWPRTADGRFALGRDDEGLVWEPHTPAFMVNWHGAMTCAAWLAEATGRPYRLPGELEVEKAARGVDARAFPWGDAFDPSWASMRLSRDGALRPASIDDFPVDESPYGVRGLAGNVVEWCADEYRREGPPLVDGCYLPPRDLTADAAPAQRALRGGCFLFDSFLLRAATRHSTASVVRDVSLGFRLVRSYA